MGFFESWPYTNFHELNLDWIIKKIKDLDGKVENALLSKITIADPIQWDITKQYEAYTIVMDNGNAYLSMQPVPYGINISNTDYWQEIFDLDDLFTDLKDAISFNDDGDSPTASEARTAGSLVWLNDTLYMVTADMDMGDAYSSGNTQQISIEDILYDCRDAINTLSATVNTLTNTMLTNRLYGKQIAIYGDSYSASPRGTLWQTVLDAITGTTCHVSAQGSLSLPEIYSTKWDSYNADIYIIQAGLNDVTKDTNGNTFMTAIEAFCTAIRGVNASAEIYFVSPPDIPAANHDNTYPVEFYRQCYWHTMSRFRFGVIDGLKWQGLLYSDNVHPTDATAPLIGKYMIASLLNYGDAFNCRDDYSKTGRADTQILFIMKNGNAYLYPQNLLFDSLAFDGSGTININQLGCNLLLNRSPISYKDSSTYTVALLVVQGAGTAGNQNVLIGAFENATTGDSRTVPAGYMIPFIPAKWIKSF